LSYVILEHNPNNNRSPTSSASLLPAAVSGLLGDGEGEYVAGYGISDGFTGPHEPFNRGADVALATALKSPLSVAAP
jgi:hypothetical protein